MSTAEKWTKLTEEILAKLDIAVEYRQMGLDITGKQASPSGWLSCWAAGRPPGNNPSAAINVGEGPLRGRNRDHGGKGESLSFFDFAAAYDQGRFKDWRDARKHFAKVSGLSKRLPHDDEERFEEAVQWQRKLALFPQQIEGLIAAYPGITVEALELCGGDKPCTYPKKSVAPTYCVAIPAYGPNLIDGGPRGMCVMAMNGGAISIYKGEGNPPDRVKRMTKGTTGLLNKHALEILADPARRALVEVVYKVEGITDMLALQAFIPPARRDTDLVVTNLCGTHEAWLPKEVAGVFAGLDVVTIHDCDIPGQDGAKLWVNA